MISQPETWSGAVVPWRLPPLRRPQACATIYAAPPAILSRPRCTTRCGCAASSCTLRCGVIRAPSASLPAASVEVPSSGGSARSGRRGRLVLPDGCVGFTAPRAASGALRRGAPLRPRRRRGAAAGASSRSTRGSGKGTSRSG